MQILMQALIPETKLRPNVMARLCTDYLAYICLMTGLYVFTYSSFLNPLEYAHAQTSLDQKNSQGSNQYMQWPTVELIVAKTRDKNTIIAQSGPIKWTVSDAEIYLKRYRSWLNWETSAPQPLTILSDLSALRRVLITAIEREVIVQYAKKHLTNESGSVVFEQLKEDDVRTWLMNLIPGAIRPSSQGLDDFIRGRLKMKAESDISFFWKAVHDAFWVQTFKESLVEQLDESRAEAEWRRQGTLATVYLLQIPRVPTSSEITQAKQKYPQQIKDYYQDHLSLFSQPLRLLVDPYWIQGGKSETQRLEALEIRNALVNGESIELITERYPQLKKGSPKTLRGRSIPKDTEIKEGEITPVRLTRYGWTFYKLKRVYPEYQRALAERSVEREVAAAVLRELDDLPRAQKLAQKAIELLTSSSEEQLEKVKKWSRSNRVRVSQPAPFFKSQQAVVPSIGLAPELHQRIFDLKVEEVTPAIRVRQHYVIAKLLEKKEQAGDWEHERASYVKSWKIKQAGQILDRWLTKHLKDEARWINSKELGRFNADSLKFESDLAPLK